MRSAVVVAASALSPLGHEWRGLGHAVLHGPRCDGAVPAGGGTVDPKRRKLMSRAAELSTLALHRVLEDAGWRDAREEIGFWAGVGASGGELGELTALLTEGLGACSPLLAFQLMNNFVLCHAAIGEGVGGPSGAFFSRGAGTTMALCEALAALEEGDCKRAIAGGADSALHAVTRAELRREGHAAPPSEGAAYLALRRDGEGLALVEASVRARPFVADVILRLDEVAAAMGQSLAAGPALAWAAALDLVAGGTARVAVTGRGLDGDAGVVVFSRRAG